MDFPAHPAGLTAPWLSAALRDAGATDRAEVVSLAWEPLDPGKGMTGTLVLLRLGYDVVEPGAPLSLVAKFSSPETELRGLLHAMRFFEREARFYERLAHATPARTPRCYFAGVDEAEGWSLILLEDLTWAPNGSWVAGSSLDEVWAALAAVARVHAAWWESPVLADAGWLDLAGLISVPTMQQIILDTWPAFLARLSVPVTAEITLAGELMQHLQRTGHHLLETPPRTLLHHDLDGDNLFFPVVDGVVEPILVDWQLTTRGHAAVDAAWLIGGQLEPAVRREHEADLLRRYHALLVDQGVADHSFEQCWDDYRLSMLLAAARVSGAVGIQAGPVGGFWDAVFPRYCQALADLRVKELLEGWETARG